MKKLWIGVGIIALIVIVDIFVRVFWSGETTDSVTEVAPVHPGELQNPGASVDGDVDKSGYIGKPAIKAEALGKQEILKGRNVCEQIKANLLATKGDALSADDLKAIASIDQSAYRENIVSAVHEYMSCKALEKSDFTYCESAVKALTGRFPLVPCKSVFSIVIAAKAAYYLKLDEARFKATIVGYPDDVRETLLQVYDAIKAKDPNRCNTIGIDPVAAGICQIAVDIPDRVPDDHQTASAYFLIKTLETGKKQYLGKIPDEVPKAFTRALLEDPGACEEFFDDLIGGICRKL